MATIIFYIHSLDGYDSGEFCEKPARNVPANIIRNGKGLGREDFASLSWLVDNKARAMPNAMFIV
jgi:hypothetical protein